MTLNFSGVLLDLDGLLLDTERLQLETGPDVLRGLGHSLKSTFFLQLVGVDRIEAARRISVELGVVIDAAVLNNAWDAAMDERMQEAIPLRPGVHRFFDALDARGLPRAIATNSFTARAEWKLEHAGLLARVDAVVGVDQVLRGKPEPFVYSAAAERLGISVNQCVAIDDSDPGIRAALSARVAHVIQIPDMNPSTDRLAHYLAQSLDEARDILGL